MVIVRAARGVSNDSLTEEMKTICTLAERAERRSSLARGP